MLSLIHALAHTRSTCATRALLHAAAAAASATSAASSSTHTSSYPAAASSSAGSSAPVASAASHQHHQHYQNQRPPPSGWWTAAAAAVLAAAGGTGVALADSSKQQQPPAEQGDGVSAGGKLLSLRIRQRIFFKYEKVWVLWHQGPLGINSVGKQVAAEQALIGLEVADSSPWQPPLPSSTLHTQRPHLHPHSASAT